VPIVFSPSPGIQVRALLIEIRFQEKDLTFQEIKSSASTDATSMSVTAVVRSDEKESEKRVLAVAGGFAPP